MFRKHDNLKEQRRQYDDQKEKQEEHESRVKDDLHEIVEGFAGGGCKSNARRRYTRYVITLSIVGREYNVIITFSDDNCIGVVPYADDPIVIFDN